MNHKRINLTYKGVIVVVLLISCNIYNLHSQSQFDSILAEISKNNKELKASQQLQRTNELQYETGKWLPNPVAEFDYLKSSNKEIGYENDFLVKQSFEFPTVYLRKKQLAKQLQTQSDFELESKRREIMLAAKNTCIEMVFRNKLQQHLIRVTANAELVNTATIKKLNSGSGNALEVNKSKLQLLHASGQLLNNTGKITELTRSLTELNGGNEILLTDTLFEPYSELPVFEIIEKEIEKVDPELKSLEQSKLISQKEIEIARSASLPNMALGYRYVGVPGGTFNGIHGGITIPLWEHKNQIKFRKAQLVYSDLVIQSHLNEHFFHINRLHEKYITLKTMVEKYEASLNEINAPALLLKAFEIGHISIIEYYQELNFYNSSFSEYLETEKNLHLVIAELNQYKL